MVAHNLPRPDGELIPTQYGSGSPNLWPDAKELLAIIDGFEQADIKLDWFKIDAGWYPAGQWHEVDKCKWWFQRGHLGAGRHAFPARAAGGG